jgi:hypothetical protein
MAGTNSALAPSHAGAPYAGDSEITALTQVRSKAPARPRANCATLLFLLAGNTTHSPVDEEITTAQRYSGSKKSGIIQKTAASCGFFQHSSKAQ